MQTSQVANLIHGSFFRPLQRMAFELIGQDRALEQLYRVLRMHSQQSATGPLVVLCCGESPGRCVSVQRILMTMESIAIRAERAR